MKIESLLYAKNARHLHLGQDDMFGETRNQTMIEHLLRLREWPPGVEGPRRIFGAKEVSLLDDNEHYDDGENEQQQNE